MEVDVTKSKEIKVCDLKRELKEYMEYELMKYVRLIGSNAL